MAKYFRIGNRTVSESEMRFLSHAQIEQIKAEGELATQKRLENMRKGLGLEPQKVDIDVTPEGIAARNVAIKNEEDKIKAEDNAEKEISIDDKIKTPAASIKKVKDKK